MRKELESLRELAGEITAELEGCKTAETFLLTEQLSLLKGQFEREQQLSAGLKKRLKLKDLIARKLTKKLAAFRVNTGGEDSAGKESESSQSGERSNSSESDMPIPLERLSTEVNRLVTAGKTLSSLYKSFNSGHSLSRRSSSDYYSENSGLEEDSSNSNSGAQSEKLFQQNSDEDTSRAVKWTPKDAVDACQICSKPFTWYRWKHHCRKCGKYLFLNSIDWCVTDAARIEEELKDTERKNCGFAIVVQEQG
eukprot:TRINITY_DN12657_c0_g1_i4.p1 TRINITY_DN12657_c0_g1~~TRINITY_DN12657_c0_g1_i4.p1  ORF type:complete len:252 (+),score=36.77 TRINITY_DN12657_c0_g1_i4:451-1206(+)